MSFPPQPPPNGPSGPGGAFGPPQGFGPEPGGYGGPADHPPYGGQGGHGYPGQGGPGGPGGYGPGGPGGYGPGTPPGGPGGSGNGAKVAAAVIGAVVVLALAIGGIVFLGRDGDEDGKNPAAGAGPSSPSPDESAPSADPTDGFESTGPTSTGDSVPYVVLSPGECYDHPSLTSSVEQVTRRSCTEPHDGEVISNVRLTGTFRSEQELSDKALDLCKPDADARLKKIRDGRDYFYHSLFPALPTYELRGEDKISCAVTVSNKVDGPKLNKPLP